MAELTKRWYALRTIAGKEQKVKEMIEAACKNVSSFGQHIERVLVPTEKIYTTRNGKKTMKDKIMVSGYVWVLAALTGEVENFLQNTTNVIGFLRGRSDNKPVVVPEEDMARMLGNAEEKEQESLDSLNDFIQGERVKVTSGAFSGFIGEIKEVNRERRELTVIVTVFGRETPLKLDNTQVEREG